MDVAGFFDDKFTRYSAAADPDIVIDRDVVVAGIERQGVGAAVIEDLIESYRGIVSCQTYIRVQRNH